MYPLVLLCACTSDRTVDKKNLNPDLIIFNENEYDNHQKFYYSEVFKSYHFVPLETNPECMISAITTAKFLGNNILIFDGRYNRLLLFNKEGKFLRNIGSQGKGPGEHIAIKEIDVDSETKRIFVLDIANKIIVYNPEGSLINEFKVRRHEIIHSFQYVDDEKFIVQLNPYHHKSPVLALIDSNGKVLKTMLDNQAIYISSRTGASSFYRTKEDIKFYSIYMNTIYQFKDDELLPYIEVNSTNPLDIQQLAKIEMQQGANKLDSEGTPISTYTHYKGMWSIGRYFETDKYIYFIYHTEKIKLVGVYIDKSTLQASKRFLRDDFLKEFHFNNDFIAQKDSLFLNYFSPGHSPGKIKGFKELLRTNESVYQSLEIKQRIMDLNENSNPVLIFYKEK